MEKIKFYCILFCVVVLSACKNKTEKIESKKTVEQEVVESKIQNQYTVKVTLKSDVSDRFQFVFVSKDKEETVVKVNVVKSDDYQTIEGGVIVDFEEEFPDVAYLGLGYFNLKKVSIKEVELSYKGKSKVFSSAEFNEFFDINKYMIKGAIEGEYTTNKIDNRLVPIFNIKKAAINSVKEDSVKLNE